LNLNLLEGENKQQMNNGNTADDRCMRGDDHSLCKNPNIVYKEERYTSSKDLSASLWWYSKASHAGSSLGSIYVGLMNHFGIGVPSNLYRASRYYKHALNQVYMYVFTCIFM
jgi:TPR repeat protein